MSSDLFSGEHAKDRDAVWVIARDHAYERYLATLLVPPRMRDAVMVVVAFSGELERIPGLVSEAMIGEIRFQWWRDALTSAGDNGALGHPLADALRRVIAHYKLPIAPLLAMIDARVFELGGVDMPDMEALLVLFGKTEGGVFDVVGQIALAGTGLPAGNGSDTARLAGHAYGLARLVRQINVVGRDVSRVLPPELALSDDTGAGGAGADKLKVVSELKHIAMMRYREVARQVNSQPRVLLPAYLPLALVPKDLNAKSATGPYRTLSCMGRLWWVNLRGRLG